MINFKQFLKEQEYHGQHTAPSKEDSAPLHNLTDIYPDDIYSAMGTQYYGHYGRGNKMDEETIRLIQQHRGNPDAIVRVYRAIPSEFDAVINNGDWVTINKTYATEHGEGILSGNYQIVTKDVPASTLYTDGNSIHEWGYNP